MHTHLPNYVQEHLVHSRCWTLAERVFGPKLQDRLMRFFESLGEYFGTVAPADVSRGLQPDPVEIPAIRELLKPEPGKQRRPHSHIRLPLPYDVQFLITELLGYTDTRNLVIAFGWELPDVFWRRRMRQYCIFEVDDLKDSECSRIDWQAVFLKLGRVTASSEAYRSRADIIRDLVAIEDILLRRTGVCQPAALVEDTESLMTAERLKAALCRQSFNGLRSCWDG